MKKRLLILDGGYLVHQSIFLWSANKKRALEEGDGKDPIPSSYNYLNSVYGILKKLGLTKEDKVLFAIDGWNSFRKAFYPIYKGQRKAGREAHTLIDWKHHYRMVNKVESALQESTPWNFIQFNYVLNFADLVHTYEGKRLEIKNHNIEFHIEYGLEADDVMAVAPKVFPDHQIVLVTIDKDINQCCHWDNVKIFNPKLKSPTNKTKKGFYVIEKNPLGVIEEKVRKGDIGDNIIVDKKNDTELETEKREFIINLLNMPSWVEKPIIEGLKNLDWNKQIDYSKLPFQNSLAKKFDNIYNSKNVRTYEESIKRHELKAEIDDKKRIERNRLNREKTRKKKEGLNV